MIEVEVIEGGVTVTKLTKEKVETNIINSILLIFHLTESNPLQTGPIFDHAGFLVDMSNAQEIL